MAKTVIFSFAVMTLLIAGCGGGGGSSSGATSSSDNPEIAPINSFFSVSVVTPNELSLAYLPNENNHLLSKGNLSDLFISSAHAVVHDNLLESQFQFARVNSAGMVLELFRPLSWIQAVDGTYEIGLPIEQRLDVVIAVRLDNQPALQVGQFIPEAVLLSPAIDNIVDIDLASTVVYQNFLDMVDDSVELSTGSGFDKEQLKELVTRLQQSWQPDLQSGKNLSDLITTLKAQTKPIVYRHAKQVTEAQIGNLAVLVSEQGASWFAAAEQEYETSWVHGTFHFDPQGEMTLEEKEIWDGLGFTPFDPIGRDELLLSDSGWIHTTGVEFSVQQVSADGGLILRSPAVPTITVTMNAMEVPLVGEKISDYFAGEQQMQAWLNYAAPKATFSEGAKGYELSWKYNQDQYWMWDWECDASEQLGGMCNQVPHWDGDGDEGNDQMARSIDGIISSVAAGNTVANKINAVKLPVEDHIAVELVADGTVNIFSFDWTSRPAKATLLHQAEWRQLQIQGERMVELNFSSTALRAMGLAGQQNRLILIEHNGYLRYGERTLSGTQSQGDWVFNRVAKQDILGKTLIPCSLNNTVADAFDPLHVPSSVEDFKHAVTLCSSMAGFGGFTLQDVTERSFLTPNGEKLRLKHDGTGEWVRGETVESLSWSLDQDGFLELESSQDKQRQLLAMVGVNDGGHYKIKGLTRENQQPTGVIWSDIFFNPE
ncbi:MAG TPA: hypothetical protein DCZ03_10815 [Gammaproteobacteria bacterium]|nr:hypothetical protein [Gammaproteobacteria bacterium]